MTKLALLVVMTVLYIGATTLEGLTSNLTELTGVVNQLKDDNIELNNENIKLEVQVLI